MKDSFRALVQRDWSDVLGDTVRLHIAEWRGPSGYASILPDGTWQTQPEGSTLGEAGLLLPAASIPVIAEAIEVFRGVTQTHGATEAKVLREWLAVEQRRVDEALRR